MQTMFLLSHKFARYMRALTGSERTKHCFGLPAHADRRMELSRVEFTLEANIGFYLWTVVIVLWRIYGHSFNI